MPRKLSQEEGDRVWNRLLPRLEPGNALTGYDGGYPVGFSDRLSVASPRIPEAPFLEAVREAVRSVGDVSLFYLLNEYVEWERDQGLEWEVPLAGLTGENLAEMG